MARPSLVAVAMTNGVWVGTTEVKDMMMRRSRRFQLRIDHKTMSNQEPPPTSFSFARGVVARLTLWPALRIAVQNNWGGPDSSKKRTWMASVIVDIFEEKSTPPDTEYIEELLLQIMDDEFETVIEDGSAESVAKDITKLWKDIYSGDLDGLHQLEQHANVVSNRPIVAQPGLPEEADTDSGEDEDDWGSDEEDNSDSPPDLPEVDEDGFTTVKGSHTKHR